MKLNSIFTWTLASIALVVMAFNATVDAQDLFLQDQLGGIGGVGAGGDQVKFSGSFKLKTDTNQGVLSLTGDIASGWHIFSVTQKRGGPIASAITVAESEQFKVVGKFKSSVDPLVHKVEGFDVPVEEHEGKVTWSVPIELATGVDPKSLSIRMIFNGQACESKPEGGRCMQINDVDVNASFAGFDADLKVSSFVHKPVKLASYQPEGLHVQLQGRVVRADGTDAPFAAGDKAILELTAKALEDFHIYTYSLEEPTDFMPTIVGFTQTNDWTVKGPRLSAQPEKGDSFGTPVLWHHDPITWKFEFTIPETVQSQEYSIEGIIGMQACNKSGCDIPTGIKFSTSVAIGSAAEAPVKWVETSTGFYDKAVEAILAGGVAKPFAESRKKAAKQTDPKMKTASPKSN